MGLQVGDLPITATPLWPALPATFVVDGSPRGLPAAPRQLYEAHQVNPAKALKLVESENSLWKSMWKLFECVGMC
eukprot:symbB.v1.2.042778.t1/scaffold11019.1/size1409/1